MLRARAIMKKLSLFAAILIIVPLLPGCREKQWWEDCYSSEEEARIDHLEADFYATKRKMTQKLKI